MLIITKRDNMIGWYSLGTGFLVLMIVTFVAYKIIYGSCKLRGSKMSKVHLEITKCFK